MKEILIVLLMIGFFIMQLYVLPGMGIST